MVLWINSEIVMYLLSKIKTKQPVSQCYVFKLLSIKHPLRQLDIISYSRTAHFRGHYFGPTD